MRKLQAEQFIQQHQVYAAGSFLPRAAKLPCGNYGKSNLYSNIRCMPRDHSCPGRQSLPCGNYGKSNLYSNARHRPRDHPCPGRQSCHAEITGRAVYTATPGIGGGIIPAQGGEVAMRKLREEQLIQQRQAQAAGSSLPREAKLPCGNYGKSNLYSNIRCMLRDHPCPGRQSLPCGNDRSHICHRLYPVHLAGNRRWCRHNQLPT